MAAFDYFWKLSNGDGSRFVATTDPGTSLEALARKHNFRKIFSSDETVGGRFSALTDFGLVPAALLGMDLNRLLDRADWMKSQCRENMSLPARNPGLALGAVMAEVCSRQAATSSRSWLMRLCLHLQAGSSRSSPSPVASMARASCLCRWSRLGDVNVYGNDRLFVYLRQTGELDDNDEVIA